jgi:glycosyltransferase involved in cell wall biosynthesis
LEIAARDRTYAWDAVATATALRRVTLFEREDYHDVSARRIGLAVTGFLAAEAPDAVAFPGWAFAESRAAVDWCRRAGRAAVLMSESSRGDFRRWPWKEWWKRRRVSRMDAAVVGGIPQARYAAELGLPPERVHAGYDVVDNAHFRDGAEAARRDAAHVRRRFGLPERYFFASCRFIAKKNIPCLLEAYAAYRRDAGAAAWKLVLCGDGPLRAAVERAIRRWGVASDVRLPGFVQYGDLPAYYGLASAFVHASLTEQWGLVVNEAMAAGLPVLVSDRCGCAPDLVAPGVNGFTFDPRSPGALAGLMADLSGGRCDAPAMGEAAQRRVADWSPQRFGEAMWEACSAGARPGRGEGT